VTGLPKMMIENSEPLQVNKQPYDTTEEVEKNFLCHKK